MSTRKNPRKNRKGFTLLEILLVLGLAAIIVLAAFFAYPKVRDASRANTEQGNIMTIAACVKSTFQGRYAGLTNDSGNMARCVPANLTGGNYAAGTPIVSSWNDSVTLATTAPNTDFTITYANVPTSICLSLVPNLMQNFEDVTIGSQVVNAKTDAATIITDCNAADPQNIAFRGK